MEGRDVESEIENIKKRQAEQDEKLEDLENLTNRLEVDQRSWQMYSERRFTQSDKQYSDIMDQLRGVKDDNREQNEEMVQKINENNREVLQQVGSSTPVWVTGMLAGMGVLFGAAVAGLVAIGIAHGWL